MVLRSLLIIIASFCPQYDQFVYPLLPVIISPFILCPTISYISDYDHFIYHLFHYNSPSILPAPLYQSIYPLFPITRPFILYAPLCPVHLSSLPPIIVSFIGCCDSVSLVCARCADLEALVEDVR